MDAQKSPARRVTIVTGDASDASRGVTRMVTRNARMVTRNGVTQSLASPALPRHDAYGTFLVTRVTRAAGMSYPPYLKRGKGDREDRYPQKGPAPRVTIVTTPTEGANPTRFPDFARTKGALT